MPKTNPLPSGEGVQSVVLALRIVEYLAKQREPVGVTEIAQALETTKSRIHRYLRTLVAEKYVEQQKLTERYRVGARLNVIGRSMADSMDLVVASHEAIRHLRDSLGHAAAVSEVDVSGPRVIATISGKSIIEIGVKVGSILGFHSSAQGKVALTFGDPRLRATILRSRMEMVTPETIVSPTVLEQQLTRIREQGYATAPNEAMLGVNALAAPIFGGHGDLIATIAIVDSVQFIPNEPSQVQVREVLAAARRISEALGYAAREGSPIEDPPVPVARRERTAA